MKSKNIFYGYIIFAFLILIFSTCSKDDDPAPQNLSEVNLHWIPDTLVSTSDEMLTGLKWGLSFLGATLPNESISIGVQYDESTNILTLDFRNLGFTNDAIGALERITEIIKSSAEYEEFQYVDLGRFLALTLGSSYHYYQIVGQPSSLDRFRSSYLFHGTKMIVINSSISIVDREIEIADWSDVSEIAYVSIEGGEFETVDFLPSGQFRFGIYGEDGDLKDVADPELTRAGKPAKCMWCHETTIQPLFLEDPLLESPDFITESEFLEIRDRQLTAVDAYRESLNSALDFSSQRDHALMEKLYIGFMEPTASRISVEWGLSLEEVESMLNAFDSHTHDEFGYYRNLYFRADIDNLSPMQVVTAPSSVRELSSDEPNFFD